MGRHFSIMKKLLTLVTITLALATTGLFAQAVTAPVAAPESTKNTDAPAKQGKHHKQHRHGKKGGKKHHGKHHRKHHRHHHQQPPADQSAPAAPSAQG